MISTAAAEEISPQRFLFTWKAAFAFTRKQEQKRESVSLSLSFYLYLSLSLSPSLLLFLSLQTSLVSSGAHSMPKTTAAGAAATTKMTPINHRESRG